MASNREKKLELKNNPPDLGGRPPKDFDQKLFKDLCKLHCTISEFEGIFEADDVTIDAWCLRTFNMSFSESFKKFSAGGKVSLRRAQYLQAVDKGNVTMQIWLGKNLLGQKDTVVLEGNEHKPLALQYAPADQFSKLLELQKKFEQENEELGETNS